MFIENMIVFEMLGLDPQGQVKVSTSANSLDTMVPGDTFSIELINAPKNSSFLRLLSHDGIPQYITVGITNGGGHLIINDTVPLNGIDYSYYMLFPNTYTGYTDPNAPKGYRLVDMCNLQSVLPS